jgi:diketogulonate reductase-like aldo/keto reductase
VQDLYLIHWPIKFEDEEIAQPLRTPDGKINPAIKWSYDFKDTWKALYVDTACACIRAGDAEPSPIPTHARM